MVLYRMLSKFLCHQRGLLIWKLYFGLFTLSLISFMLTTFSFVAQVPRGKLFNYKWNDFYRQENNEKEPPPLLSFHEFEEFSMNDPTADKTGVPTVVPKLPKFDWYPDLTGTYLEGFFTQNSTSGSKRPSCSKLMELNGIKATGAEKDEAKKWKPPCQLTDPQVAWLSMDCTSLRRAYRFDPILYATEMRQSDWAPYPLGFVVLAGERNADQLFRLFSHIYRPWHAYCITYDNDASPEFQRAIKNLDRCFDNVALPLSHPNVKWASFAILESAINCLQLLNENDQHLPWNYVQFVSWNDFPLRTMPEMAEIARILNGSQDVELTRGQIERYVRYHKEAKLDQTKHGIVKPVPPGDLVIYKGSMSATLSRDFVRFLFTNQVAMDFFNWSRTTFAAEEQFWSTLVHNANLKPPGYFPASCLSYYEYKKKERSKPYISRFQIWYRNCAGRLKSGSCIFGVGDLPKLTKQPELFAHKVYGDFEPATLYCLSEFYFNRTYEKFGLAKSKISKTIDDSNMGFSLEFYENLPAVRYQNMADKMNFTC